MTFMVVFQMRQELMRLKFDSDQIEKNKKAY
jgi:hypothetical protein